MPAYLAEARAQAAKHAFVARAAELSCTQLLAERTRVADELASRPHVVRALADRRRLAQQPAEAAQRAEAERASRLAHGVAAVRAALGADLFDEAARLLAPLAREFSQEREVQGLADVVRWRDRQRLVVPAENALGDVLVIPTAMILRRPSVVWPACR